MKKSVSTLVTRDGAISADYRRTDVHLMGVLKAWKTDRRRKRRTPARIAAKRAERAKRVKLLLKEYDRV